MKYLHSGIITGSITGMFLFIVCAFVEYLTPVELMTLLLNVDFLTERDLHTITEIILHLAVSIMIAVLLKFIFDKFSGIYIPALIFSWIVTSIMFYLLEYLSVMTIVLHGFTGFIVWTCIHLVYFILMFILHKKGI